MIRGDIRPANMQLPPEMWCKIIYWYICSIKYQVRSFVLCYKPMEQGSEIIEDALIRVVLKISHEFKLLPTMRLCKLFWNKMRRSFVNELSLFHAKLSHRVRFMPISNHILPMRRGDYVPGSSSPYHTVGPSYPMIMTVSFNEEYKKNVLGNEDYHTRKEIFRFWKTLDRINIFRMPCFEKPNYKMLHDFPTPSVWGTMCFQNPQFLWVGLHSPNRPNRLICGDIVGGNVEFCDDGTLNHTTDSGVIFQCFVTTMLESWDVKMLYYNRCVIPTTLYHWCREAIDHPEDFKSILLRHSLNFMHIQISRKRKWASSDTDFSEWYQCLLDNWSKRLKLTTIVDDQCDRKVSV